MWVLNKWYEKVVYVIGWVVAIIWILYFIAGVIIGINQNIAG